VADSKIKKCQWEPLAKVTTCKMTLISAKANV